jgi:hypothetical protein
MAAKKQGLYAITVEPASLRNLLQVLNKLDKETQNEVRDAALPLSNRLAGQLRQFADSAPSPQTKLVAQSIAAKRDRLIRVDVGGTKKVGRKYGGESRGNGKRVKQAAAPAGALLWGTEYGSGRGTDSAGRSYTDRFKAPRNKQGYWIAPAVDYYTPIVAKEYIEIITKIIKREGLD